MVFKKILGYLTPKMGNKNYYKGRGVRGVGHSSSIGRFIVDPKKTLNIYVPENYQLETPSGLKPYVSRNAFQLTKEQVQENREKKHQRRVDTLMKTQKN
ncbi:hypothetical protein DICPUDRAFT_160364 [Dictyostelium purpureum]|uniref:Uncharacterized protein n=1 Tax=Dictyostelium purpureum TaxID=5786 RepID=F1A675_DICPU|nr:uncharacterized protein DICPUDRAFT_160364 [Dictyostelium purpureum]EGC28305.1 hypothetical protein DICPUDRAFT_160364 [Dictyostelium purpureum]|eukprot:XP_003295169.1 hypothetical protein DICPUDRAFT_160364 [Dictyostelium purpureum]